MSPAGSVFGYSPIVADNCGLLTISRLEGLDYGSTFPVGDATVTVDAVDTASLTTITSLRVHARGADEQLGILQGLVAGTGPGRTSSDIVAIARNATSSGKVNAGCEAMSVFVKLVTGQTGGKIDVVTAGGLRDRAGRISAVLGWQQTEAEVER